MGNEFSKVTYDRIRHKNQLVHTAQLNVYVEIDFGKFSVFALGVGITKEDAQIQLHTQLQEVYEKIGNEIEALRDVIQ
jgi:hypothetical protein